MVHCVRCRYHLDDATASERCPECGLPTRWSQRPVALAEYPPAWVDRMGKGSLLILSAYLMLGIVLLIPENIKLWSAALIILLLSMGMWDISFHSRHWVEPKQYWLRGALRILLVANIICFSFAQIGTFSYWSWRMARICGNVDIFLILAIPPLVFLRLRVLTSIIGDPRLKEYCAIVAGGSVLALLCVAGGMYVEVNDSFHTSCSVGIYFVAITFVLLLLFILWGTIVLIWCVISLLRAMRISRQAAEEWRLSQ